MTTMSAFAALSPTSALGRHDPASRVLDEVDAIEHLVGTGIGVRV